jgi:hypothetical protein
MVLAESDTCYTMSADAFRQAMDRRGAFYDLLTRYGQAWVGFIMQSTAATLSTQSNSDCPAGCCWHTIASEKMNFHLTQEFAAMMLLLEPSPSVNRK